MSNETQPKSDIFEKQWHAAEIINGENTIYAAQLHFIKYGKTISLYVLIQNSKNKPERVSMEIPLAEKDTTPDNARLDQTYNSFAALNRAALDIGKSALLTRDALHILDISHDNIAPFRLNPHFEMVSEGIGYRVDGKNVTAGIEISNDIVFCREIFSRNFAYVPWVRSQTFAKNISEDFNWQIVPLPATNH